MRNHHEYLIIGGGIAGICLSHELRKAGKSFLLVNDNNRSMSTTIAAGMFNPISGKRFTVNWRSEELLKALYDCMTEMEEMLRTTLLIKAPTLQAFGNIKESNDFFSRLDHAAFSRYVDAEPKMEAPLLSEFGRFASKETGWVRTAELTHGYHKKLETEGTLLNACFEPDHLKKENGNWSYKDHTFEKVVFCEGHYATENPWFKTIPYKLAKGQVLLIRVKGLDPKLILKRAVYLVHQNEDIFKVGATYEWDFKDDQPTEEGKNFLTEKVKEMIPLSFEVVDHLAGIRPASKDRNVVMGPHPDEPTLYLFNGLGTKGILQAPYFAKHLKEHLLDGTEIHAKVNISRMLNKN